ncbi:hypothetical protein J2756_001768 [Methanobacterium aggregans]|nr:DUF4013 domain-containing protein [Methanobacterium aggregans]MBP2046514.1 hypothetical protein [Methanobacterium aggregans]
MYMILIIPTIAIAIANMANNNSKISAAFKFHEIINKISNIGWENLIIWYIITGILYLILLALSNIFPIGQGLMLLIVIPCFYMYLARSVALLYTSNKL